MSVRPREVEEEEAMEAARRLRREVKVWGGVVLPLNFYLTVAT
jgi:hypothetical protein